MIWIEEKSHDLIGQLTAKDNDDLICSYRLHNWDGRRTGVYGLRREVENRIL